MTVYKQKYRAQYDAWWRPLTLQGDPSHRYNLVGEAFDAGYEAGKSAALLTLGRKLVEEYTPYSAVETRTVPMHDCCGNGCLDPSHF